MDYVLSVKKANGTGFCAKNLTFFAYRRQSRCRSNFHRKLEILKDIFPISISQKREKATVVLPYTQKLNQKESNISWVCQPWTMKGDLLPPTSKTRPQK